jgi:hypothetical protein
MRVDWGEAPYWAQWLAVDQDGRARWYEERPTTNSRGFLPKYDTCCWDAYKVTPPVDFTAAVYQRPQPCNGENE